MLNILVAPCSFKGSLSAGEAATAISRGLQHVCSHLNIHTLPLADGGEGTLAMWAAHHDIRLERVPCLDALERPIEALVGWREQDRIGLIEAAQALGITLIEPGCVNRVRPAHAGWAC